MTYQVVPASPLHVGPLVRRMSASTKLQALNGRPRAALRNCMMQSDECWSAMRDGVPLAMWGVIGGALVTEGYVWFCVTEAARQMPISMVRGAATYLRRLLETRHAVTGLVLPDDVRSIRFAEFLGFSVGERAMDGGPRVIRIARG